MAMKDQNQYIKTQVSSSLIQIISFLEIHVLVCILRLIKQEYFGGYLVAWS